MGFILTVRWIESQLFRDVQIYGFDVLAFPTMKTLGKESQ